MWAALRIFLQGISLPLVTRVLAGLGFGVATYTGVGSLMSQLQSDVFGQLGSVAGNVLNLLVMARVDDFMRLLFSAATVRLTIKGLTAAGAFSTLKLS